jgi:isocitrate lyase
VLVPISEHINRLVAIRLQYDIMGVENLVIARTDSEAATLITTNVDERDHAFILGTTNPDLEDLVSVLNRGEREGKSGEALQAIEDDWTSKANLVLYNDAVVAELKKNAPQSRIDEFLKRAAHVSNSKARKIAKEYGVEIFWDWDRPRTREGYYHYQGGTQCAVNRAVAFAPYSDLLVRSSLLYVFLVHIRGTDDPRYDSGWRPRSLSSTRRANSHRESEASTPTSGWRTTSAPVSTGTQPVSTNNP